MAGEGGAAAVTEPFAIVPGRVKSARRQGFILGMYACSDGHGVLVVCDKRGNPIVEVHMDGEQEAYLTTLIRENRAHIIGQAGTA